MSRDFDYSTLTLEDRRAHHEALAHTTLKHIDNRADLFSPMPFDLAQSQSQILETVSLPPVPADLNEINALADIANPNLGPFVRETLRGHRPFMGAVRHLLREHVQLNLVTTHVNIADIALWQHGWVNALELDDWQDRNGLIISRGVTTIQAFGMAASEVCQKLGHVFLSYPRTETIAGLDVDSRLIDTNNRHMRTAIDEWRIVSSGLARLVPTAHQTEAKMLHTAWEGKTAVIDWGDDHQPARIKFGKVAEGTLSLVKQGLVVPVVIWDSNEPRMEIGDITRVHNKRDAAQVQEWQRATMARLLELPDSAVTVQR